MKPHRVHLPLYPTLIALAALFVVACQDGESSSDQTPIALQFEAKIADAEFDCEQTYSGIGDPAKNISFRDARLYISEITLLDENGGEHTVQLEDNAWQHQNVALLDFEDATGTCSGNADTNTEVSGTIETGTYTALRFHIGVPFSLNHLDNASAVSPLNLSTMYWGWKGGYKYMRIDVTADETNWNFHLGASPNTCEAEAGMAPASPCGKPNISTVKLDMPIEVHDDHRKSLTTQTIAMDLAALFASTNFDADTEGSGSGCMMGANESADCIAHLNALDLDPNTGTCASTDCGNQSLFSLP